MSSTSKHLGVGTTGFVTPTSGFSMCNLEFNLRFINSSEGDFPVVVCGVIRYAKRNLFTVVLIDSSLFNFFIVFLNVRTALSAHPFVAG